MRASVTWNVDRRRIHRPRAHTVARLRRCFDTLMWDFGLCRSRSPCGCVDRVRHWYAVYGHPDGVGVRPWFAVADVTGVVYPRDDEESTSYATEPCFRFVDQLIYPVGEDTGQQPQPWFELRGSCVYSTAGHPRGASPAPWYQMR